MSFNIKWVNHAGYLIANHKTCILVDPWLTGDAFNNGWSLLSETAVTEADLHAVTHIWFSHEHPDHFSVSDIKEISTKCINLKHVIFQKTRDQRVANFCRNLGLSVVEVGHLTDLPLSNSCSIRIGQVGKLDSYSILEMDGSTIVNANDCVLDDESLRELACSIEKCDVLLSQFSYASYISNPDKPEVRMEAVKEKFREIRKLIDTLSPTYVVPFASYIYFCHEENFYMNDSIADVKAVADEISGAGPIPVVLYPGDSLNFTNAHFETTVSTVTQAAISRYKSDLSNIEIKYLTSDKIYSMQELRAASEIYLDRIFKANGWLILKTVCALDTLLSFLLRKDILGFKACSIHITDIDQTVTFDWLKGLNVANDKTIFDIEMSSESLHYIFKFDWGFSTLNVNGRLIENAQGGLWRVSRIMSLGLINSIGITFVQHLITRITGKDTTAIHDTEPSFF